MKIQEQHGQTLIEAIVAVALILFGVVSIMALAASTLSSGRSNQYSVVGYNLAREGVEIARSYRDNNWLSRERGSAIDWNTGLYGMNEDYTAILDFDPSVNEWSFNFDPSDFDACINDGSCRVLHDELTGLYQHTFGEDTPYYRFIHLRPICADGIALNEGNRCDVLVPQVGVEIESLVRWQEKGSYREAKILEQMYNWKIGN